MNDAALARCPDCEHIIGAHREGRGCMVCDRSAGPCAVVAIAEPRVVEVGDAVPEYARVVDYERDGTHEAWAAVIAQAEEEAAESGETIERRSRIEAFKNDDDETRAADEQAHEADQFRVELVKKYQDNKNVSIAPLQKRAQVPFPIEIESLGPETPLEAKARQAEEYFGGQPTAVVREAMRGPTTAGKNGGGSKSGKRAKKPGDSAPATSNAPDSGGETFPLSKRRITIAVTIGEFVYYSSTNEETSIVIAGVKQFMETGDRPRDAAGKTTRDLVMFVDARVYDVLRFERGLGHAILQQHVVSRGIPRERLAA